jgi:hypothetical protein
MAPLLESWRGYLLWVRPADQGVIVDAAGVTCQASAMERVKHDLVAVVLVFLCVGRYALKLDPSLIAIVDRLDLEGSVTSDFDRVKF